jgi:hypothetical protein
MAVSNSKITKPTDFKLLDSYTDPKGREVEGDFPVYVSGVSLCCEDNTGYIEAIPIDLTNLQ